MRAVAARVETGSVDSTVRSTGRYATAVTATVSFDRSAGSPRSCVVHRTFAHVSLPAPTIHRDHPIVRRHHSYRDNVPADLAASAASGRRLLLTTHYWHPHTGGIETVAAAHTEVLTARGWSVEAHTSRTERSTPSLACDGAVELHRHRSINPFERLVRVPVPFPAPGIGRQLSEAARRCDIVMAHGHVYPITVAAARAARRARRPFVVVQHNPWVRYPAPIEMIEGLADRAIGRRVLEQAEIVLCVSKHTQAYVRMIAPGAATRVVGNGVDSTRFMPAGTVRPSGSVRFVCVRRLVPRTASTCSSPRGAAPRSAMVPPW